MSEEHGYQRSGKKCREKFENLYKYYKKTKEGKAGRQDGKHYRFFRQLEALCGGDNSNQINSFPDPNYGSRNLPFQTNINQEAFQFQKRCDSLSLTGSTGGDTSEDDEEEDDDDGLSGESTEKRRKKKSRRRWRAKIKDFIDSQMSKLMEKQEMWMERVMSTMEEKERERILKEEEWRRSEEARMEKEHRLWAEERAWIEARDAALMDALQKITSIELKLAQSPNMAAAENKNEEESEILNCSEGHWPESEISRLLQLRAEMESRFQRCGASGEAVLWEEIAGKMACFGHERTALACKDKWESIRTTSYQTGSKDLGSKKRKEDPRECFYFENNSNNNNNDGSLASNSSVVVGNPVAAGDGCCFPFLMSEGSDNLWENYGLRLSKGNQS